MNRTRSNWLFVVGVALIVMGGFALIDRFFGSLWRPVAVVLAGLSSVAWPLVLVVLGVVLMSRARGSEFSGELRRSRTDRVIGGVIGGVAERLGTSAVALRVVYVVLALITGLWAAAALYLIALVAVPEASMFPAPAVSCGPVPAAPPVPPAPGAGSTPAAPPVPATPVG